MKIEEARVGARIKCGMLSRWLGMPTRKPFTWFKGTITNVYYSKNGQQSIVINVWNKKFNLRLKDMMCVPRNGEYRKIKLLNN